MKYCRNCEELFEDERVVLIQPKRRSHCDGSSPYNTDTRECEDYQVIELCPICRSEDIVGAWEEFILMDLQGEELDYFDTLEEAQIAREGFSATSPTKEEFKVIDRITDSDSHEVVWEEEVW